MLAVFLPAVALSLVFFFWKAMAGWRLRRARCRRAAGRRRQRPAATTDDLAADLINDLAAIRGYCELARMGHPGDPALRQRMDAAMASCTEVSASIRELRTCARNHPSRSG